jgi:hypothetical protein
LVTVPATGFPPIVPVTSKLMTSSPLSSALELGIGEALGDALLDGRADGLADDASAEAGTPGSGAGGKVAVGVLTLAQAASTTRSTAPKVADLTRSGPQPVGFRSITPTPSSLGWQPTGHSRRHLVADEHRS